MILLLLGNWPVCDLFWKYKNIFTASAQWDDYMLRAHFHDPAKPANMRR
jgi:hypothetical protein